MHPSNQVFSIQLIYVCCVGLLIPEPPVNTCNWQMQKQGRVRGQREVHEAAEERRAREELFVGYIIEMSVALD